MTDPYHLFPEGTPTLSAETSGGICPVDTGPADTGIEDATLSVTVDGDDVTVVFHGELGCNVPTAGVVGLDAATGTAMLVWPTGDCDIVVCVDVEATFVDFPSGSWHLSWGATATTVDIVVP